MCWCIFVCLCVCVSGRSSCRFFASDSYSWQLKFQGVPGSSTSVAAVFLKCIAGRLSSRTCYLRLYEPVMFAQKTNVYTYIWCMCAIGNKVLKK